MSESRKKPLWPWVMAVFGLPVLYVLSSGPACWITAKRGPEHVRQDPSVKDIPLLMRIYLPLGYLLSENSFNSRPTRLLQWWMALGAPRDCSVRVPYTMNGKQWTLFERGWVDFPYK